MGSMFSDPSWYVSEQRNDWIEVTILEEAVNADCLKNRISIIGFDDKHQTKRSEFYS